MDTIERVRALAAEGKPASQIAAILGISRQRIYQIAKTHDLELPSYHAERRRNLRNPPQARVITGGVLGKINESVAGSISELLVAADLMARGLKVFMPILSSKGHDIIALDGDFIRTFEVRSAHRNKEGHLKYAKRPDCKSQHYALVVSGEAVTYEPGID